ncbi:hypothetical protein BFW01_g7072 [Lasiodiplodia theobromae]|uniref:Uncharacterized protein n=1 Tax=Lasiodiplodia theobromae TaxID=45133 RepID=A0A5N5DD19_9PEZI|nr:hypothetical protein DBV05_g5768 [Lasiodiplodia theobromae]KAF9636177.1 hypothetical protein BFW01_g7072 [Lasiodiplodia theobromae]
MLHTTRNEHRLRGAKEVTKYGMNFHAGKDLSWKITGFKLDSLEQEWVKRFPPDESEGEVKQGKKKIQDACETYLKARRKFERAISKDDEAKEGFKELQDADFELTKLLGRIMIRRLKKSIWFGGTISRAQVPNEVAIQASLSTKASERVSNLIDSSLEGSDAISREALSSSSRLARQVNIFPGLIDLFMEKSKEDRKPFTIKDVVENKWDSDNRKESPFYGKMRHMARGSGKLPVLRDIISQRPDLPGQKGKGKLLIGSIDPFLAFLVWRYLVQVLKLTSKEVRYVRADERDELARRFQLEPSSPNSIDILVTSINLLATGFDLEKHYRHVILMEPD